MNIFKTKIEAEDHAACKVSDTWLYNANRIILRGDIPMPFTRPDNLGCPYGRRLSVDEMDCEIYNRFRYCLDSGSIYAKAKDLILNRLSSGEFPAVRAHFTPKAKTLQPS